MAKTRLTRVQKNKVDKLRGLGSDNPRKQFIASKEAGLNWRETKSWVKTQVAKRTGSVAESGQDDGGRLSGSFRDRDVVGSENEVTEFDGRQFSGGDASYGAGGGSGSSLAGRESVSRVGETKGQSMEDVVYGVRKRGRKVKRARGE